MANNSQIPASPRALSYMRDLFKSKDISAAEQEMPPNWLEVFVDMGQDGGAFPYISSDCSKFIDWLKKQPAKAKVTPPAVIKDLDGVKVAVAPERRTKADVEQLEEGMYRRKSDGEVFKVYRTQRGHLAAKQLRVHRFGEEGVHAEVSFEYIGKAPLYSLFEQDRLTIEEAANFGKLYGVCMICARTLTNELSIALGIGPVCGDREFGGEFKFMVDAARVGKPYEPSIDGEVLSVVDGDDADAIRAEIARLNAELEAL